MAHVSAMVDHGRLLELAPLLIEPTKHVEFLLNVTELASDAQTGHLPRALVVLHRVHQLL